MLQVLRVRKAGKIILNSSFINKILIAAAVVFLICAAVYCVAKVSEDDEESFAVTGGEISVVNGIEEAKSGSTFDMFITPEEAAEDVDNVILKRADDYGEGYLNNCVFLGDSRTVAMVSYACINDDDALAQIGISHMQFAKNQFTNNAGKQYTLKSYLDSHKKPVVYVSLGVNGMYGIDEEDYEKAYSELVDYIVENAPASEVVLMSIWPVDDNGRYAKTVQNSLICTYNEFLYGLAKEKDLYFLNINEILTSDEGQIIDEYDAGDGLHYSKTAYDAIMEYIISHPVPGVGCDGEYVVKYIPPRNNTSNSENSEEAMDDEALMKLYDEALNEAQSSAGIQSENAAGAAGDDILENAGTDAAQNDAENVVYSDAYDTSGGQNNNSSPSCEEENQDLTEESQEGDAGEESPTDEAYNEYYYELYKKVMGQ